MCSRKAARRLLKLVRDAKGLPPTVVEHLSRREAFLRECGGFELLRAHYYFDNDERARVYELFDLELPSELTELRSRKTRFSDVAHSNLRLFPVQDW